MMRKASPDTDQTSRSLLQKAVRRSDLEMTKLAIAYIISDNDFDWMRKRLAVVTFEECWTYGLEVSYENDEKIITDHFLKIVGTVKIEMRQDLVHLLMFFRKAMKVFTLVIVATEI